MIIHSNKENTPKIIEFDNPKEIGHFGLIQNRVPFFRFADSWLYVVGLKGLFDMIKHRRKKNLVWVNKLSYLNPEGKNIYRVDKLSYQTSSLAKEITLSLDQRVQFERWALTSKLIISWQLVNAVAKRKEKKLTRSISTITNLLGDYS